MHQENAVFSAPENPETRIWRYVDLSKYMSLLLRAKLFFPTASRLRESDPHEGAIGAASIAELNRVYQQIASQYDPEVEQELKSRKINVVYPSTVESLWASHFAPENDHARVKLLSCWHMNPSESMAMWQQYAGRGRGIAIASTYARLRDAFSASPVKIHIGKVRYVDDYATDPEPMTNAFAALLAKRVAFRHEQELRAVAWWHDSSTGEWFRYGLGDLPAGFSGQHIAVDLNTLVEQVRN